MFGPKAPPFIRGGRIIIYSHTRVGTGISLYRLSDGPLFSTDNWIALCSSFFFFVQAYTLSAYARK